jgi:Cation efflux family
MLSFVRIGRGSFPCSLFAIAVGWMACIVIDFLSAVGAASVASRANVDHLDAFLVGLAHVGLLLSTVISPSSITRTSPRALLFAAGLTSLPVLLRLYFSPLRLDLLPLVATTLSGAIAVQLSQPTLILPAHLHQLTYPLLLLLASLLTLPSLLTILPSLPLYYGIFSLPPPTPTRWLPHHPVLKKILYKEDSKKIFVFLCLNLGFMCVQMGYGMYTNSLGLVSDSVHMLVDCAAIVFGLVASVLADTGEDVGQGQGCGHDHDYDHTHDQGHIDDHEHHHEHGHTHDHEHHHNANDRHGHEHSHRDHGPTGKWAKLEDLAGFANGIFLVFVCLSILSEAVGRLIWPEEVVEVEQLLVVSVMGLAVNLVGVFSFNHGYTSPFKAYCRHMGHSHDHHHNSNMHG